MNESLRLEYLFSERYKLKNINLTLYQSEILGLVVQNHDCMQGMLDLLIGSAMPDAGAIYIAGKKTALRSRYDAKSNHIGCVLRRPQLIRSMPVYENIFLIRGGSYFSKIYPSRVYIAETKKLLDDFELTGIRPTDPVWSLDYARRHLIEIVKAVALQAKIIILDNIFERYTEEELFVLGGVLRTVKHKGISVIFLTDKYTPLFDTAERVVVVRKNTTAANVTQRPFTKELLQRHMSMVEVSEDGGIWMGQPLLKVEGLRVAGGRKTLDFCVQKGEVLGITEPNTTYCKQIGDALTGQAGAGAGIYLDGQLVDTSTRKRAVQAGIGYVKENEFAREIIKDMSLVDNITLMIPRSYDAPMGFTNQNMRAYKARQALEKLGGAYMYEQHVHSQPLMRLSPIEQMRVLIAKWMCAKVKVMVFLNPYLGLDEQDIISFGNMVRYLSEKGVVSIMISSNLGSIAFLCDRILAPDEA